MKTIQSLFITGLLTTAIACGGGGGATKPPVTGKPTGPTTGTGEALNKEAENKFNSALDAMVAHDEARDWAEASCTDVAKRFESAGLAGSVLANGHRNVK